LVKIIQLAIFHLTSFIPAVPVNITDKHPVFSLVKHSPSLTDISKIKQSYVAWPANTPLSLKCKADGEPPLEVSWYKNGKLIKSSENIFQDQKWNLKFRKPQLADNGVYTCVVKNYYGSIKHNYSLRILRK
jgi:hypothetical protein